MKLNKNQVFELNNALSSPGLKVREVSGHNYLKILSLKSKLKSSVESLVKAEGDLIKDFDGEVSGNGINFKDPETQKEFSAKRKEFYDAFELEVDLNFLPEKEFMSYVKEQETYVAAVLYDFLLENKGQPE
jgi:hypothetical protein